MKRKATTRVKKAARANPYLDREEKARVLESGYSSGQIKKAVAGIKRQRKADWANPLQKILGDHIGTSDVLAYLFKHGVKKSKRNPASQASEAYTDFHGRASEEVVTVQTKVHYHKHLAACGELRKLVIKPVGKLFSVTLSGFKKALLAFNEKRTQLFIEGGDQAVDLKQFGIKTPHETETLGEVRVIEYFTIKDHLGNEGGKAVYVHKFHKPYPVLIYNVLDQQLTFSGGSYKVLAEGIDK